MNEMWNFSLWVDQQVMSNSDWINTQEGQLSMSLIQRENKRLSEILKNRKQNKIISKTQDKE